MTSPHPDASLLITSNESLVPLLQILNAFNHRHRNQHSSSHWWSSFSLLRRAVRNLSTDLASHPPATKGKNKSKSLVVERHHYPAFARAKWMLRHTVPRAYFAFSQLAADNQHALLGLLLLSVLARINYLLSDLVPNDSNPNFPSSAANQQIVPNTNPPSTSFSSTNAKPADTGMDMGVAISRQELLPGQNSTSPQPIVTSESHSKERASSRHKSKSTAKVEIGNSLSTKSIHKDKAKKKKKKGNDAFSSLFGSL
ncbi:ribonuclease mrp subunit rmp1 [Fusarium albosuccineum]|uniref:Ribonuclease mrp subunit rmp1 n=1 Tax=Fusarium albosuccineum TaxID=1237068 RepID=A0A8H4LLP5_9HYPO|nr:ribonuclease mrp subunit rmp1 [Fusarium albosuccineum]